jgi:hypothetical protein
LSDDRWRKLLNATPCDNGRQAETVARTVTALLMSLSPQAKYRLLNLARNIPKRATNDKYAKLKQLSVIGVGPILAKVDKKYPAYGIQ